jgi:activator of HSP90 ATPase
MNLIKKLHKELEKDLFERIQIVASGSITIVEEGAGIIPQGYYLMDKEDVESMVRKRIIREIRNIEQNEFAEVKIRANGSSTIVEEGKIIPNGHYLADVDQVESMIHNRIFRDYMGLEYTQKF